MKYQARVTAIVPLLKNIKRYKDIMPYKVNDNLYIDVDKWQEANVISAMNNYQEHIKDLYQILLEIEDKEDWL